MYPFQPSARPASTDRPFDISSPVHRTRLLRAQTAVRTAAFANKRSAWQPFFLLALVAGGFADLPRQVALESVTGLAVLSTFFSIAAWGLWFLVPGSGLCLPSPALPFVAFVLWAILSVVVHEPTVSGIQNVLVLASLVGGMCLAFRMTRAGYPVAEFVMADWRLASWCAAGIYGLELIVAGPGATWPMGARAFALFALLALGQHLAAWRYRSMRGLTAACLLTAMIGLSLSRLALGASLLLFPIAQMPRGGLRSWLRLLVWCALVVGVAYSGLTYIEPLRDRFFEGDVSLGVGDVKINASGRTEFWDIVWQSYEESPWIGKGAGSAQEELASWHRVELDHPHNDYLRILHDYGLLGLTLWLAGYLSALRTCWCSWRAADRRADTDAGLHLTVVLALIAVALSMLTDNTIVYSFLMVPLGILTGTSLGRTSLAKLQSLNSPSVIGPSLAVAHWQSAYRRRS